MRSWKQWGAAQAAPTKQRAASPAAGLEKGPAHPHGRSIDWPRIVGVGRGVLLGVVVLAPEAAAWQGLLAFARDTLHMTGGWEFLVPLLFGAAAFYVALLAQRHVLAGDSATTERLLTWGYAAAGAGFNWWHADRTGATAAALFFGGASLSAALLWDRTLRAWRRDQLREIGALERPLPRFRALRWLLAPGHTFAAFRMSVLHGLSTADEALALVELGRPRTTATPPTGEAIETPPERRQPAVQTAAVVATDELLPLEAAVAESASAEAVEVMAEQQEVEATPAVVDEQRRTPLPELGSRSKADAVREVWRMLGVKDGEPSLEDVRRAVDELAERGVEVTPKYAREVRLRDQRRQQQEQPRPVLTAVAKRGA